MKTLIILRGCPCSGKSTFVKKQGWENYTIEPDKLRVMFSSFKYDSSGKKSIDNKEDGVVWKTVSNMLETRMKNGAFTVIDATNIRRKGLNEYKTLADKYRYRVYVVDFTDVPVAICKERNLQREASKIVPEYVIDKFSNALTENTVPSSFTVIKPEEIDSVLYTPADYSGYKAIHHFGDIHGCYTALKQYIDEQGGIKDNELYIFTGDYLDRGCETKQTLLYLMELSKLPNVIFLEGNHEIHLRRYVNNEEDFSDTFCKFTKPRLADISTKDIKRFLNRLGQMAYYTYGEKTVVACHGGVPCIPDIYTMSRDLIYGADEFEKSDAVDEAFFDNTPNNVYQIHAHRNVNLVPTQVNDRVFNLEGMVEMGGCLRVVKLTQTGFKVHEIKNEVYNPKEWGSASVITDLPKDVEKAIPFLESSSDINEKKFGNISSFNFTEKAFCKGTWNSMTIKARGLFINKNTNRVVNRGYDKFFNIEENHLTSLEALKKTLVFPITGYNKENGFLGLLGYDEESDTLIFSSKSRTNGLYSDYFRNLFMKQNYDVESIKEYLKNNNKCMAFEVIDIINDPHIIKYEKSSLILLDVFERSLETERLPYEELLQIGKRFNMNVKKKYKTFQDFKDFLSWYHGPHSEMHEGWVFEDSNGFMFKYKTPYYLIWKYCRSLAQTAYSNPCVVLRNSNSSLESKKFFQWVITRYKNYHPEQCENIIALRDLFYS